MCPGIFGYRGTLLYIPCDVISITCELGVVFRVNEISRSKPLHCSIPCIFMRTFMSDWYKIRRTYRVRTFSWRLDERIIVCPVPGNDGAWWTCIFRHADGRGPGGRAPGLSDWAVPGMPAGKGSRVCRPYGEIHHPAGDGDQGDRTGAGRHTAEAGRRTARRGRRRGPRPGQGVSRGRCGRVAARKQELRPTQNTDLTKYNLRVCCTAP